jgi:hypothetical protein
MGTGHIQFIQKIGDDINIVMLIGVDAAIDDQSYRGIFGEDLVNIQVVKQ